MQIRKDFKHETNPTKQISFENYIQQIKDTNEKLAKEIAQDFKTNTTIKNIENLQKWLQLQNIINMYHVCLAFERGALFYSTDSKHPICQDKKSPGILTTISSLMPVIVTKNKSTGVKMNTLINFSYLIKDKSTLRPTQILSELLFHRTSYDCTGSVTLSAILTLLDLMKVVHGEVVGTKLMDDFLSTDKSKNNLTRLILGAMSVFNISAANFITIFFNYPHSLNSSISKTKKSGVSLNDLITSPEKYLGVQIYIGGHKNYMEKHPHGSAQGWNAIFIGLDTKGSPLFLAAGELGQKFLVNYEELKCILTKGYNEFPQPSNSQVNSFGKNDDIRGIVDKGTSFFHIQNIIYLLSQTSLTKKFFHDYVDNIYKTDIITNNGQVVTDSEVDLENFQNFFITKNIIKKAKDDCDPLILKFFKPSFRPDITKSHSKDDSGLPDPKPIKHNVRT